MGPNRQRALRTASGHYRRYVKSAIGTLSEHLLIDFADARAHILMTETVPAQFLSVSSQAVSQFRIGSEFQNRVDEFCCRLLSDEKSSLPVDDHLASSPDIEGDHGFP